MAFNQLTPAQAELLALLSEELGEAQQAIGKILRHGYESKNPTIPDSETNREVLERELGDVEAAQSLLVASEDLNIWNILASKKLKLAKVSKYLHEQK